MSGTCKKQNEIGKIMEEIQCPYCDKTISQLRYETFGMCETCKKISNGMEVKETQHVNVEKSLPFAIGLNIIFPGFGYIYMGKLIIGIFACLLVVTCILISPYYFYLSVLLNIIMAIDMIILRDQIKRK